MYEDFFHYTSGIYNTFGATQQGDTQLRSSGGACRGRVSTGSQQTPGTRSGGG